MADIKIKDRQTLLDIALVASGSLDSVFDLAIENNISVTEILVDGNILDISRLDVINANCVTKYQKEGISPATELSSEDLRNITTEGIDFMCIGDGTSGDNYFVIS